MIGSRHRTISTEEREKLLKEPFTGKSTGIKWFNREILPFLKLSYKPVLLT